MLEYVQLPSVPVPFEIAKNSTSDMHYKAGKTQTVSLTIKPLAERPPGIVNSYSAVDTLTSADELVKL